MRGLILIAALLVAASGRPGPVLCDGRAEVLGLFALLYGEWQITSVHRQQDTTVEVVHAAGTGTWAVMGENYRGQTCIEIRQTVPMELPPSV